MKGLVLSDEESVKEKLFGFDEAMEVNSNTVVLHCASIIMLMPFSRRDFRSKRLSRNRLTAWLLMIFQIIWKHQNPPDCSKVKFLIIGTWKSGMWLDDGYYLFNCTTKLLIHTSREAYSRNENALGCDRCWLEVWLVTSFDKNNPYYEHGWLMLHIVSYFTEISILTNTKYSLIWLVFIISRSKIFQWNFVTVLFFTKISIHLCFTIHLNVRKISIWVINAKHLLCEISQKYTQ